MACVYQHIARDSIAGDQISDLYHLCLLTGLDWRGLLEIASRSNFLYIFYRMYL